MIPEAGEVASDVARAMEQLGRREFWGWGRLAAKAALSSVSVCGLLGVDYRILKGGWFKREGPRDP